MSATRGLDLGGRPAMPPDPDLSPAARDVIHEVGEIARQYPDASPPVLVLKLARRYIKPRLKWGER